MDLRQIMQALAHERPIFHSEADFQHALAWQIHQTHPEARVRLETSPQRGMRLDVLVTLDGVRTAIELKYVVTRTSVTIAGESFDLAHQAAGPVRLYDTCKDLQRCEGLLADGHADQAHVILLTNVLGLTREGHRDDTVDADFRLHHGRRLAGQLRRADHAGPGTMKGREDPLTLRGD